MISSSDANRWKNSIAGEIEIGFGMRCADKALTRNCAAVIASLLVDFVLAIKVENESGFLDEEEMLSQLSYFDHNFSNSQRRSSAQFNLYPRETSSYMANGAKTIRAVLPALIKEYYNTKYKYIYDTDQPDSRMYRITTACGDVFIYRSNVDISVYINSTPFSRNGW